jgi:hypothetical protein
MDRSAFLSTEERLAAVEDRLDILNLLAGSALSSDVGSESYWSMLFAEDAVMDRSQDLPADRGREQIVKIVRGDGQRAAVRHGMAHLAALPHITIDGDRASATGYLLVVVPDAQAPQVKLPGKGSSFPLSIYHLTVNRWQFVCTSTGWQVSDRLVRPVGTDAAREIISCAIDSRRAVQPI